MYNIYNFAYVTPSNKKKLVQAIEQAKSRNNNNLKNIEIIFNDCNFFTVEDYQLLLKNYDTLGYSKDNRFNRYILPKLPLAMLLIFESILPIFIYILLNPKAKIGPVQKYLGLLFSILTMSVIPYAIAFAARFIVKHDFSMIDPKSSHISQQTNNKNLFLCRQCLKMAYKNHNTAVFEKLIKLCLSKKIYFSSELWSEVLAYAVKLNLRTDLVKKIAKNALPLSQNDQNHDHFVNLLYAIYTGNAEAVKTLLTQDKFLFAAQANTLKYALFPDNTLMKHTQMMYSFLIVAGLTNSTVFKPLLSYACNKKLILTGDFCNNLIQMPNSQVYNTLLAMQQHYPKLVKIDNQAKRPHFLTKLLNKKATTKIPFETKCHLKMLVNKPERIHELLTRNNNNLARHFSVSDCSDLAKEAIFRSQPKTMLIFLTLAIEKLSGGISIVLFLNKHLRFIYKHEDHLKKLPKKDCHSKAQKQNILKTYSLCKHLILNLSSNYTPTQNLDILTSGIQLILNTENLMNTDNRNSILSLQKLCFFTISKKLKNKFHILDETPEIKRKFKFFNDSYKSLNNFDIREKQNDTTIPMGRT